jgi:hypothetical protein
VIRLKRLVALVPNKPSRRGYACTIIQQNIRRIDRETRNRRAGKVGCACLLAAVTRGSARQVVLVNRTRKTAEAAVTDVRYGVLLGRKVDVVDGDYDELKGVRSGDRHFRY